jgi:hypothetical protein
MPPPPPQFDFPIPEYVKNTRVDYNVVENYLMTGNFLNGLEYTDSILHLKKDDIQVHKKRVIFLNKLDRYTETYESVKIICYNTAEYKYIADFGELAVLTGNYNDWILFRKNNPELKGKINDRYLMKFHDFIVNVFLNNYIDPIEYQSILDASVILKIRGWSFDLIEAYCVKNIQDSQILQKIQILIEEAEK